MGTYNILSLAKRVDPKDPTRTRFEIDSDAAYPETIRRIREVLDSKGTVYPSELGNAVDTVRGEALQVPSEGWDLALVPRDRVTGVSKLTARYLALEAARHWFTQALHVSIKEAPMEVYILPRDLRWRL